MQIYVLRMCCVLVSKRMHWLQMRYGCMCCVFGMISNRADVCFALSNDVENMHMCVLRMYQNTVSIQMHVWRTQNEIGSCRSMYSVCRTIRCRVGYHVPIQIFFQRRNESFKNHPDSLAEEWLLVIFFIHQRKDGPYCDPFLSSEVRSTLL